MGKTRLFIFLVLFTTHALGLADNTKSSLINPEYIREYLTHEAAWADSHGAKGEDLGVGMLYYALVYAKRAKFCVCLGSGGGFVPRVMRQAQRDLRLKNAKTLLIDGNKGDFGRPQWLADTHFFKQMFPDVEIWIRDTHEAALSLPRGKIDYLHIDADHSFEGAYQDFLDFLPLMSRKGIITLHDTQGSLPCSQIIPLLKQQGYEVVNFDEFGAGVAIIYLH